MDEWKDKGIEVLGGVPTKLPDAEWPGLSVYYMEAALRGEDASGRAIPRRYSDAYVIQFPRNVAVLVTADTFQDDPMPFRKQVRETLKTLQLGAPKP